MHDFPPHFCVLPHSPHLVLAKKKRKEKQGILCQQCRKRILSMIHHTYCIYLVANKHNGPSFPKAYSLSHLKMPPHSPNSPFRCDAPDPMLFDDNGTIESAQALCINNPTPSHPEDPGWQTAAIDPRLLTTEKQLSQAPRCSTSSYLA